MMRKALTMATLASLLIAGSAFAQWGRHAVAQPNATFAAGVGGAAAGPNTTNNDDTCDISVAPAATLLLPYFEVETSGRATTTFFQITNTSRYPQVAHVTLWTDWSFPVLDFNIFLTGFDVQPIDLYDVIVNAQINGTTGTTSGTLAGKVYNQLGVAQSVSSYALSTDAAATGNPNFGIGGGGTANCANLPGQYNTAIGAAVKSALISGVYNAPGFSPAENLNGCTNAQLVGSSAGHGGTTSLTTAIGYVTIDVASICSARLPIDPTYFQQEILFDNVLTGDYQIFNKTAGNNYAGGNPLVHIRAIPEGGVSGAALPAGVTSATNLPYTFYSRYVNGAAGTVALNYDRRQPLPSVFAARYIYSAAGNAAIGLPPLDTKYRVWREGQTGAATANAPWAATSCTTMTVNSALPIREIVRFDEHENAVIITNIQGVSPNLGAAASTLPETSSRSVSDTTVYPQMPASVSTDAGGWMYLNLDNKFYTQGNTTVANTVQHPLFGAGGTATRASQNWVSVSESGSTANNNAAGAYAVDFDATWLGNGCSGLVPTTTVNGGAAVLGPVGGSVVTGFTNVTP
jgi:hypothetical protein